MVSKSNNLRIILLSLVKKNIIFWFAGKNIHNFVTWKQIWNLNKEHISLKLFFYIW